MKIGEEWDDSDNMQHARTIGRHIQKEEYRLSRWKVRATLIKTIEESRTIQETKKKKKDKNFLVAWELFDSV
jgi:hypothetical protein